MARMGLVIIGVLMLALVAVLVGWPRNDAVVHPTPADIPAVAVEPVTQAADAPPVIAVRPSGPGGRYSIDDRLRQYGPVARYRWQEHFRRAGLPYPPSRLVLVAFKDRRVLDVYAAVATGELTFVRSYAILAASGQAGPKLREGDRQVPEGIYAIESLNPNSRFHLSLRVGYPNAFDRRMAQSEGRSRLGGDIMIHGSNVSVGCIAVGDEAAEDLFVLAADVGLPNIKVVIAPSDLRKSPPAIPPGAPAWTPQLYSQIKLELDALPQRR